jgi:hypothetical protein
LHKQQQQQQQQQQTKAKISVPKEQVLRIVRAMTGDVTPL